MKNKDERFKATDAIAILYSMDLLCRLCQSNGSLNCRSVSSTCLHRAVFVGGKTQKIHITPNCVISSNGPFAGHNPVVIELRPRGIQRNCAVIVSDSLIIKPTAVKIEASIGKSKGIVGIEVYRSIKMNDSIIIAISEGFRNEFLFPLREYHPPK